MPKEDTQFKSGNPGGPGRRKGSRNKMSEDFVQDFHKTWTAHGTKALEYMAINEPVKLVQAAVQILPKNFLLTVDADQVTWVINASPRLTEKEWRLKHGLTNQGGPEKKNPSSHSHVSAITIDQE